MAWRCPLSRSLISTARASTTRTLPPLPLLRPPPLAAPHLQSRLLSFASPSVFGLNQEKCSTPPIFDHRPLSTLSSSKSASNSSEILSYMGGIDGDQKQLIKKLVNFRMKKGKKTKVRSIVYQTFHRLARTEHDAIKVMADALENVKPVCEVEKVGIAGTLYDVPGIVPKDRQQTLAIRWILDAAFKRRVSHRTSLEKCLYSELLDAYRKRGIARKKRESLHGLALTNRSFAHFRWW
ncbi:small ribosomal subunit protein uS7m [Rhododendron vialii]|uniref:small ribosomal subunit protein uS7m n=1 Tax=Rhododendron vialii TaxID=182163 RepID=UPI00265E7485|nr:small ribosomal subunit protein uS7m [Rhododendron vialii]XP_058215578.1 small ribosomal subunit protein uS7m [Rhododendron vialii]XP_058215579.1 small ribosomal subunit protein uS7m [Rhododendron vialii]